MVEDLTYASSQVTNFTGRLCFLNRPRLQHLANRQDRTWYFSSYLHLCISKKHSRWWIHYSYYIPSRERLSTISPQQILKNSYKTHPKHTPCVTAMIAPRETVMEILKEANGVLHYEVVASKLAEALQRGQPETGEAGDLKLLALASIPLDFCNETDPFVRYPAESSKKRKAEAMDIIFTTLGEIVFKQSFQGVCGRAQGWERCLGCVGCWTVQSYCRSARPPNNCHQSLQCFDPPRHPPVIPGTTINLSLEFVRGWCRMQSDSGDAVPTHSCSTDT